MRPEHDAFAALFAKLERERGFQGMLYRQKCMRRRVAVRMRARGVATPQAYSALLDRDPTEYERLLGALTINVSRFFRNPETWDAIRRVALPALFGTGAPGDGRALRMWSAGTATGEEAYSLAILALEWLEAHGERTGHDVRIVATDIDREVLDAAAAAEYQEPALAELPDEVRRRWFTPAPPPYRVREPIRSLVEFRYHDLLSGAPDFRADLVLCRNLLIYLDRPAQRRVHQVFAEVIPEGGFLVLGRVETLDAAARAAFEPADSRERVYRRVRGGGRT